MIVTFTYPLPDELYVEGVSGDIVGTYTYDGPELISVTVGESGQIRVIDPQIVTDDDLNDIVEIDPSINPEVAFLLMDYFIDDPEEWVYQFEDVIMDNGDIYKNPLNPHLRDAYSAVYDRETSSWKMVQNLKEPGHPNATKVQESYNKVKRYSDAYEFTEECEIAIQSYLLKCEEYLAENANFQSWKYINFNLSGTPKIPSILVTEFAKVPDPAEETNLRDLLASQLSGGI